LVYLDRSNSSPLLLKDAIRVFEDSTCMGQSQQSLGILLAKDGPPMYQQVFDQIVERIANGAFAGGFRLPPSRSLARGLGVHRNTIVRAYEALEDGGFVESTVGRGTFVRPPAAEARSGAAPKGGISWASLLSRAAMAEPLSRSDRMARSLPGGATINMARMQPPAELLPVDLFRRCANHALEAEGAKALGYAPREGVPRLREGIAQHLSRRGVPSRAEEILITTGSQQALDLLARALIDPGDTVLVDASTYAGALNVFATSGARLLGVPSDAEGPELSALERLGQSGAKALYLMPDAQNPTALTISTSRRKAIVAWSRRSGVPIIEDGYVSDLYLDNEAPPVAMRALDGDVLYIGSFSKMLIPALRVGYVVFPESVAPRLTSLKHALDLGTSALLQHALAEFLERGYLAPHLERVRAEYRARRDALVAGLEKHLPEGASFHVPTNGVALFVHLPDDISPAAAFEAAAEAGVLASPSTLNTILGHSNGGGLRLTFCNEPPKRLAEGARRIGRALAELAESGRPKGRPGLEGI
jgi:GntR family transcriptional regulator/MocR family aminotransferase